MGLFSNNKKPCPICGSPTPRILPTEVAGTPLCKACADKIDLPDGVLQSMSLEDFRQYIAYYDANAPLREQFRESYRHTFGLFSGAIAVDGEHRLLRLKGYDSALVFTAAELTSFCVYEDDHPLYENGDGVLRVHRSKAPEEARAALPKIEDFLRRKEEYERMEELVRRMEKQSGAEPERHPMRQLPPEFSLPAPVKEFYVELHLNTPYWKEFRMKVGAPDYDRSQPSVTEYLDRYESVSNELRELAWQLMQIVSPGAQEKYEFTSPETKTALSPNALDELPRYKQLLDAGVITEEEFAAKKRQLLSI